jgi:hypothetical protein
MGSGIDAVDGDARHGFIGRAILRDSAEDLVSAATAPIVAISEFASTVVCVALASIHWTLASRACPTVSNIRS